MTDDPYLSPLYDHPAEAAVQCPRCGKYFEKSIRLPGGKIVPGHVAGDPRTCVAKQPLVGAQRDKRYRPVARR